MDQPAILVLYHGNCYDGFGAAWAAWRRLGDTAIYQPAIYGVDQSIPEHITDIYFVDFAPPRDVLLALIERRRVRVLDHHATAAKDLADIDVCRFDLEKSGAHVTWEYFHDTPPPTLIRYIEDRDLWRYALPSSREIHAWLQSYPKDFGLWTKLAGRLDTDFEQVAHDAKEIVRFKQMQVRDMADQTRWVRLGGYPVPVANATAFFSEVGEELCLRNPEAPFAGYYFDRKDGHRQWGLRSRNGFDVSAIAKTYGGGGHPAASGFTSELTFFPEA